MPILRPATQKFLENLRRNLDEAVHESGGVAPLAADLKIAAAEFDWPGIPNAAEPWTVDMLVNYLIDMGLNRAHDLVHVDPPAPPVS